MIPMTPWDAAWLWWHEQARAARLWWDRSIR